MIVKHLLESPLAFVVIAMVLGEACWITNKRVQEQDQPDAIRLIGAFLSALLVIVLLTLFFGVAAGSLIAWIIAKSHHEPGWAFAALVLGSGIGCILGNVGAFLVCLRISRQFWPNPQTNTNT